MQRFFFLISCLVACFSKNLHASENLIDTAIQPFLDRGGSVAISIGIIQNGKTTIHHAGELVLGDGKKPDSSTLYEIGSITKVLTAVTLAREVVEKRVQLETPVASLMGESFILPSYQNGENHFDIQLLHLATHSSRLPRLPDDLFQGANPADPYAHYDQDRLRASLGAQKINAAPGGKPVLYSNFGFGLLGFALAEKHAMSYPDLLKKSWLDPLGMTSTSAKAISLQNPNRARGYDVAHNEQAYWSFQALAGAGSVHSNLTDMLRFAGFCLKPNSGNLAQALAQALELSMKPHIINRGRAQCLGWQRAADQNTYWHNGQTAGFASYLAFNRQHNVAVCILSSGASPQLTALGEHLVRCAASGKPKPFPIQKPKLLVPPNTLTQLTGIYQLAPGQHFTVRTHHQRLFVKLTGQQFLEVFPETNTRFHYRAVKARIDFKPGTSLTLFQNGRELTATKMP